MNEIFLRSRTIIFIIAFFVLFTFLLYQAAVLLAPFFHSLLWAALIAFATHPLYRQILPRLKGGENITSALMTFFVVILVIGPMVLLSFALTAQMLDLYKQSTVLIKSGEWTKLWDTIRSWVPMEITDNPYFRSYFEDFEVMSILVKGLREISTRMAGQIGWALKNLFTMTVNFLIMIFSLFFFYRDGERLYQTVYEVIPLSNVQKLPVAAKFKETLYAVIYGILLVSLAEGIIIGLGFALFDISFSIFWGFLAFVLAVIPVLGAAAVWIPGSLFLILDGQILGGILLALWGFLFTSLPDSLLKPILIGKRAGLPVFFLFIGILGGIKVHGVAGVLLGPLIVALVLTFIQIYREEYTG